MSKPLPVIPSVKNMIDLAYSDHRKAEDEREAARKQAEKLLAEKLDQSQRDIIDVVTPALEGLSVLLNDNGTSAKVTSGDGSGAEVVFLEWGEPVPSNTSLRPGFLYRNKFQVHRRSDGSLRVMSGAKNEELKDHGKVPDQITSEWIQTAAGEVISRTIRLGK